MIDSLKNVLFTGLGMVALTQEKLKALVDELVKKGELTAEQGKKVLEDFIQKGQVEGRVISERIAAEVTALLARTPVATRQEVERLEVRVRRLEAQLGLPPGESSAAPSASQESFHASTGFGTLPASGSAGP